MEKYWKVLSYRVRESASWQLRKITWLQGHQSENPTETKARDDDLEMIYQSRSIGHKETTDSRLKIHWDWCGYMRILGIKGAFRVLASTTRKKVESSTEIIHLGRGIGFVREDGKFSCRHYEHELSVGHPTSNQIHRSKAHRRNQDWRSKTTDSSGPFFSLYNINLSLSPQPLRYYSTILSQFVFIKSLTLILSMLPKQWFYIMRKLKLINVLPHPLQGRMRDGHWWGHYAGSFSDKKRKEIRGTDQDYFAALGESICTPDPSRKEVLELFSERENEVYLENK